MNINRRELIVLGGMTIAGLGCQSGHSGGTESKTTSSSSSSSSGSAGSGATVDAGPASQYAADGVYANFRGRGFFLVRRGGGELVAYSSICTHRTCPLNAQADGSFLCKCHGSRFDPEGHVTKGPATKDLPVLPVTIDAQSGHVLVSNVRR